MIHFPEPSSFLVLLHPCLIPEAWVGSSLSVELAPILCLPELRCSISGFAACPYFSIQSTVPFPRLSCPYSPLKDLGYIGDLINTVTLRTEQGHTYTLITKSTWLLLTKAM